MLTSGPATAAEWVGRTGLGANEIQQALLKLEAAGTVLRGRFHQKAIESSLEEWSDRDVLARIHRRCLARLRRETEPVSTAEFVRFLLRWHHVAPGTQLHGPHGLAEVIGQLQGLQLPAAAWEAEILPARIVGYHPSMLDALCAAGAVVWGRLLPGRKGDEEEDASSRRRNSPNRNTTLSLMLREDLPWLLALSRPEGERAPELGAAARSLLDLLETRGAMFFNELHEASGRLRTDLDQALWELVTAGQVTCDGFAGLRNLIDPHRRREKARLLARYAGSNRPLFLGGGGRWSLLRPKNVNEERSTEKLALQHLHRWGVVFRDVLGREPACPPWRDLLGIYRRLEARGEIRGGRFVNGHAGEQFALPEAVEALRASRRDPTRERIELSAADPLNVTGTLIPGPRTPATLARRVILADSQTPPRALAAT
jgi:ATP-dependent Lhr-like helicase